MPTIATANRMENTEASAISVRDRRLVDADGGEVGGARGGENGGGDGSGSGGSGGDGGSIGTVTTKLEKNGYATYDTSTSSVVEMVFTNTEEFPASAMESRSYSGDSMMLTVYSTYCRESLRPE